MQITSIEVRAGLARRRLLAGGAAWALAAAAGAKPAGPGEEVHRVQVWKGPACACCKDWIAHLEAHGFQVVSVSDSGNTEARKRLGIDLKYGSCHTALVGGYALEGHVPASDIRRLLRERPKAIGLVVPAMPLGSPGMDGPAYGRKQPYDVLLLAQDGSARVYQSYR
ncbi:DUF411 domain-containing protein [Roseateles sp. DB2]|uniref:DUF411 domain-containing protein n=1 Tax=Roseateles sp. DB2 TaxID=3453717 RepID=UPI003EF02B8B